MCLQCAWTATLLLGALWRPIRVSASIAKERTFEVIIYATSIITAGVVAAQWKLPITLREYTQRDIGEGGKQAASSRNTVKSWKHFWGVRLNLMR